MCTLPSVLRLAVALACLGLVATATAAQAPRVPFKTVIRAALRGGCLFGSSAFLAPNAASTQRFTSSMNDEDAQKLSSVDFSRYVVVAAIPCYRTTGYKARILSLRRLGPVLAVRVETTPPQGGRSLVRRPSTM